MQIPFADADVDTDTGADTDSDTNMDTATDTGIDTHTDTVSDSYFASAPRSGVGMLRGKGTT